MDSDLKKLFFKGILGLLLILVGIIILSHLIKEPIHQFSTRFVENFGVLGVGFGVLLSDSLPAFLIPDAFLILAVAGELPDLPVVLVASLGSLIGGSNSYFLGRYIFPRIPMIQKFLESHEHNLLKYLNKYGTWAVVLAATTPLPYSWMSYLVGSFKMPFWKFFIASLWRIPRFIVYYYAIKIGWFS